MFRSVLYGACLFGLSMAWDASVAATDSGVLPSLSVEAQAADFTGKIRRIRIRPRNRRSGFTQSIRMDDAGDGSSNSVAKLSLTIQDAEGILGEDGLILGASEVTHSRQFKTPLFAFSGANPPEGQYRVLAWVQNSEGEFLSEPQQFEIEAQGLESVVTSAEGASSDLSIVELEMSSDACGNARFKAKVEGERLSAADTVSVLFEEPIDGPAPLDTEVLGSLRRGKSTFNESFETTEQLAQLAEIPELGIVVTVTALDADGQVLGVTRTDAMSKYGDILIDGVPLEFD